MNPCVVTLFIVFYLYIDMQSGEASVLVAGDPERAHMAECERRGGIPYHPNQITYAVSGRPIYKYRYTSTHTCTCI